MKRVYYTFEMNDVEYLLTHVEFRDGKIYNHYIDRTGRTYEAIEMQYGMFFTGSTDSIDRWLEGGRG